MTDFKDIQNRWSEQETNISVTSDELLASVKKNTIELKNKHIWTQLILFITCIVLIIFFFYVTAWKNTTASVALSIMTGVIIIRLILELVSLRRFQNISITENVETYNQQLLRFYKWRRRVHFVFTPIILVLYFTSFAALMPIFKQTLSHGFYLYIQVSAVFVFLGLCFVIGMHIKKEVSILNFLKDIKSDKVSERNE
jgi:hypothetical protein